MSESGFRMLCQRLVYARYDPRLKDPVTGKERNIQYKGLHKFLGRVTYLDWVMTLIMTLSCVSMMFETPKYRIVDNPALQVAEYCLVLFMSAELAIKILADGLLFTPKAYMKDVTSILHIFIYVMSVVFVCWMPRNVPAASGAQLLMILRCVRPLRIPFLLMPDMRKMVNERFRVFKKILMVWILLIVLLFLLECYDVDVEIFEGRLSRCEDITISRREDCVRVIMRRVMVNKMKLVPDEE